MSNTSETQACEAMFAPPRANAVGSSAKTEGVRQVLPEGYYLEHFRDFLDQVSSRSRALLNDREATFLEAFRALNDAEQRLYVRLANRRGRIFFCSGLRYPEIPGLAATTESLRNKQFVHSPTAEHLAEVLLALRKPQLVRLLAAKGTADCRAFARATKSELREQALATITFTELSSHPLFDDLIVQGYGAELSYLSFLMFGDIETDSKLYALRDLGIREANGRTESFAPRFTTAAEARSEYEMRLLRARMRELEPAQFLGECGSPDQWPAIVGPGAARIREKTVWDLSAALLKAGQRETALHLLAYEASPRAVEKRLRTLYAMGERELVRGELSQICEDPPSSSLLLFAEDFLALKFGGARRSRVTEALRSASTIRIDPRFIGKPEQGVAEHFSAHGAETYHVENELWCALFGLLFWEELFSGPAAAISSEFDFLPHDLRNNLFYARHSAAIETKLRSLQDARPAAQLFASQAVRYRGTSNGLFRWNATVDLLPRFVALSLSRGAQLADVLREMAQDFARNHSGFPDLVVFERDRARFVEVKTIGDTLHPKQLRQLLLLTRCGFQTEIARVVWDHASDQTYVVLDVETTGGLAQRDRITEVGAVKVQRGVAVDRFSSLINPERRIPRQIVELTGITDAMVSNAPKFSDVAPALRDFIGDAILVGHNVSFDYGFLREEFWRLGSPFSVPSMCTRVEIRRHFPNLGSYALGELCRHFEIALEQHHRALCDAEATVQLLLIALDRQRRSAPDRLQGTDADQTRPVAE